MSIKIGVFTLTPLENGNVYISQLDGEGFECDSETLEELIAEFYEDNV
jgi:hypothetical protein